ncbi:MAG: hypothetical protein LBM25_07265 [Bacteroidales bacterium]|jgi:hypothetical protein|nr:hypothetical protein [Bacteroidales bacterium]
MKEKILITVKTYPNFSNKYKELVCTAGFKEDGSWIRLYPIPFRRLDYNNQYEKWQWIEIDVVKNEKDHRIESFRPVDIEKSFTLLEKVGTENKWEQRKKFALKDVYTNMESLIESSKGGLSLATFKPKEITDFIWEKISEKDYKKKEQKLKADESQLSFFPPKEVFSNVKPIPYKFSYKFTSEDGKERTLMIEDWELGSLYWNCLKQANQDEETACQKVKDKYFTEFINKKDLYFFLGTTQKHHNISKNPFIIIGTFYPPKITQMSFEF